MTTSTVFGSNESATLLSLKFPLTNDFTSDIIEETSVESNLLYRWYQILESFFRSISDQNGATIFCELPDFSKAGFALSKFESSVIYPLVCI